MIRSSSSQRKASRRAMHPYHYYTSAEKIAYGPAGPSVFSYMGVGIDVNRDRYWDPMPWRDALVSQNVEEEPPALPPMDLPQQVGRYILKKDKTWEWQPYTSLTEMQSEVHRWGIDIKPVLRDTNNEYLSASWETPSGKSNKSTAWVLEILDTLRIIKAQRETNRILGKPWLNTEWTPETLTTAGTGRVGVRGKPITTTPTFGDRVVSSVKQTFNPTYGRFVGAGWSGGTYNPTILQMTDVEPVDVLDAIAKEHDLLYHLARKPADVTAADVLFARRVKEAQERGMFTSPKERATAKVANTILKAKRVVEKVRPFYGVDLSTSREDIQKAEAYLKSMELRGGIVEDFWRRQQVNPTPPHLVPYREDL